MAVKDLVTADELKKLEGVSFNFEGRTHVERSNWNAGAFREIPPECPPHIREHILEARAAKLGIDLEARKARVEMEGTLRMLRSQN